jgi:hypothetical protein
VAIAFNGTTQYLLNTTPLVTSTPLTVGMWFRLGAVGTAVQSLWALADMTAGAATITHATAAGTAERTVTSSGAASAPAATAAGTAERQIDASGAAFAPATTAAGVTERAILASGAAFVPAATASGDADVDHIATGGNAWNRYQAYRRDHPEAEPRPRKYEAKRDEPAVEEPAEEEAPPPVAAPVAVAPVVPAPVAVAPVPVAPPKPKHRSAAIVVFPAAKAAGRATVTGLDLAELDNDFIMMAANLR